MVGILMTVGKHNLYEVRKYKIHLTYKLTRKTCQGAASHPNPEFTNPWVIFILVYYILQQSFHSCSATITNRFIGWAKCFICLAALYMVLPSKSPESWCSQNALVGSTWLRLQRCWRVETEYSKIKMPYVRLRHTPVVSFINSLTSFASVLIVDFPLLKAKYRNKAWSYLARWNLSKLSQIL